MKKEYYLNKKQDNRLDKRIKEFEDSIFKFYKAYVLKEITLKQLFSLENTCKDTMKGYLVCMNDMGFICKECVENITLLLDNYISNVEKHFDLEWIKVNIEK